MSERPNEFVVQRSKWLRGDVTKAVLLDSHGRMCCLGFVSAQCGVPAQALGKATLPSDLEASDATLVEGLLVEDLGRVTDTALADGAVGLNDADDITDAERETRLTALFAEHGYTLRFEP